MSDAQHSNAIITLTTDFGVGSRYVAAMKGVILSINRSAQIVDISHAAPPRDIRAGAIVLAETVNWFPPGLFTWRWLIPESVANGGRFMSKLASNDS